MISGEFLSRGEALEFLKLKCPKALHHVFADSNAVELLEIFVVGITSENLFIKIESSRNNNIDVGYSAYLKDYRIHINVKKAALTLAVLLLDILISRGLASIVMSQVIKNPIFISDLSKKQHLLCLLDSKGFPLLTKKSFKSSLKEGKCKNKEFICKYKNKDNICKINSKNIEESIKKIKKMELL